MIHECASGNGSGCTSRQTTVEHARQAAVLPAELMELPNLAGFLSLASVSGVIRLDLDYRAVPQKLPALGAGAPSSGPDLEPDPAPPEDGS